MADTPAELPVEQQANAMEASKPTTEAKAAEQPGTAKEATSGEDSDATVPSSSEEADAPSQRYGLRKNRKRKVKEGSHSAEEAGAEEEAAAEDGKAGDDSAASKPRRKRGAKQDGTKQDGLLRLAQIAHAAPQMPKKQEQDGEAGPEATEATAQARTGEAAGTLQAAEPVAQQALPGQEAAPAAAEGQPEQRLTPAQFRALVHTGQPPNLPGYHPVQCPFVSWGARWQLDLRTGERLEEQLPPQLGMQLMQAGQAGFAIAGQAGPRPPIFTGPAGQMGQPGYGVVPPASSYASSLPIQALGQQPLSQGLAPAGPYTALLGPQMQSLLPPGVLPPGQYPAGFSAAMQPQLQAMQQQSPLTVPPKKRQRSSHAAELADLPEIPLRRRGRPAGDGAASGASPQELQERRMQANRAAASRSHFRRKREMELLEKECSVMEARAMELRATLAGLVAQEEQLRLQQAGIREHLATGCKPGEAVPQPPQAPAESAPAAEQQPKAEA